MGWTPSDQKAYDTGRNGGTVSTTGMSWQDKARTDANVNQGRKDSGRS